MKTGLVIFAHGSTVEAANEAVRAVSAEVARRGNYGSIETAFLDVARPDLREAARRLVSRGAERIIVLPYFLTEGSHIQEDLPRLVREFQAEYPNIKVVVAATLDGHPALIDILLERAREALR